MRRSRFAALFLSCFVVLAACDEEPQISPLSIVWLEWPDTVAAGAPFPVRVVGEESSDPKYLRVVLRADNEGETIEAYSVAPPCTPGCPPGFAFFDTVVQVPGISAAALRTFLLRARTRDVLGGERVFGVVTVSPGAAGRAVNRGAGPASGFQDSFGCFLIVPAPLTVLYASADQSPAWAPGFTGFVHGRFDAAASSPCILTAPVLIVDSIR